MNYNSLVKILSLKDTNKIPEVHVIIDTLIEEAMDVILRDGTILKFKEWGLGLYYYDMTSNDVQDSDKTITTITPYSLLSTVTENKEFYTRVDIEGLDREIRYQLLLGWTPMSDFTTYVNNKLLLNCRITVDDIDISDHIYG